MQLVINFFSPFRFYPEFYRDAALLHPGNEVCCSLSRPTIDIHLTEASEYAFAFSFII